MAKEKKKFTLPHSEYLKKNGDKDFVLVAMPAELFEDFDVIRDAIVDYMPGYNKDDFEVLRDGLDWVDNIEEALCVNVGK